MAEPSKYSPSGYGYAVDRRFTVLQQSRLYGARPWGADDQANWVAILQGYSVANFDGTGLPGFVNGADSFF